MRHRQNLRIQEIRNRVAECAASFREGDSAADVQNGDIIRLSYFDGHSYPILEGPIWKGKQQFDDGVTGPTTAREHKRTIARPYSAMASFSLIRSLRPSRTFSKLSEEIT